MASSIISPRWGKDSVATGRDIVKHNQQVIGVDFLIHSCETWLPLILSETGFFVSNGDVKRQRPQFWRDVVHGETIELSWCKITIVCHSTVGKSSD